MIHSPLLERHLKDLTQATDELPVLDLACGSGRNGLYLARHEIPVVFADIRSDALKGVADRLFPGIAELWQVDLEQQACNPLGGRQFFAILVFRYLHRPLLPAIREAVHPGGLVIYETFTREQPKYGRPRNPAFLLLPGALDQYFCDWQILHSFEGITETRDTGAKTAIAQIVARKPTLEN